MATILRTKIGDGLRDSEKLSPVNADYSEQALQTLSAETKYYNVILQDMNNARALKRHFTQFTITQGRRGVGMVLYEGKVGKPASKVRWRDLTKLLYCQAFGSKPHANPFSERSAINAIIEATTAHIATRSEVIEAAAAHAEVAARLAKHNEAASLHAKRREVIAAAFGLLKDKDVLPLDALQFEREMRDE